MAETASILSPEKKVLIPDPTPAARSRTRSTPTSCAPGRPSTPAPSWSCTSTPPPRSRPRPTTAAPPRTRSQVVEHIWREHGPETEILFGPDMWLGSFVARETGLTDDPERYARFHVWDGECHVHAGIRPDDIAAHPRRAPRRRVPDPPRVRLLDPGDGVRRLRRHLRRRRPHALDLGDARPRRGQPRGRVHRRHRDRDALPAPAGGAEGEPDRGQPDGLLQVHEDDHAAEGPRLAARPEGRGQGRPARSPSARSSRSSAWSRSASLADESDADHRVERACDGVERRRAAGARTVPLHDSREWDRDRGRSRWCLLPRSPPVARRVPDEARAPVRSRQRGRRHGSRELRRVALSARRPRVRLLCARRIRGSRRCSDSR